MLMAIGRFYIACTRIEWYLGEILVQSGMANAHELGWFKASEMLKQKIVNSAILQITTQDTKVLLENSLEVTERIRKFRNRTIHGFLGKMHNEEGWIILKKKSDDPDDSGEKITKEQFNQFVTEGDAALGSLKWVLQTLYSANGLM